MKKMRAIIKWQLIRDGELYSTVYDTLYDAIAAGEMLRNCGWITEYRSVPIKAVWLKA